MSGKRSLSLDVLEPATRKFLEMHSGGIVTTRAGEVVQFLNADLEPVSLPRDVAADLRYAAATDGTYRVPVLEVKTEPRAAPPPKPKREDYPGDEVSYFRAAAAHHAAVSDSTE